MISNKRSVPPLVLFLLVSSIVLYHSVIQLFPSFIHAWTQSDRYAIALRFLDNGFDIFHPATFNLQTVEGITRVDFPINEFLVAVIMKITGNTAPVIFRLYILFISISGLVYLYLLAKRISGSEIKSWFTVLFVFLSPVYVYYQAGFIPSIPAIASVFAGYYYFFSYKDNGNKKLFYYALLFFLLSSLMRLPFVIILFAVMLQQGFMSLKLRVLRKHELIGFVSAFLIFAAYYLYNIHLGRMYGNMFLDSFLPAKNFSEFKEILMAMYDHWCFHYFSMWHYILLFVLILISVLTLYRRGNYLEADKKYWFQFLIAGCGSICYFLLMARQYYSHDYYFLDSMFVPTILLFMFVLKDVTIETVKQKITWSCVLAVSVILFFIANFNTQAERYSFGSWDRVEITRKNFTGTEEFLDSLGVSKDAKILVIDAYTTNAPLLLMNRKGYTVMGTTHKNIGVSLQWGNWDLVAIQDIYLVSDVIKNYPLITSMLECVGSTGRVSFYKKSPAPKYKTLKQFLGINPERTLFVSEYKSATSQKKNKAILNDSTEFGITASVKASELKSGSGLKVLVSGKFFPGNSIKDIQLVASINTGEEQLFYQSFALNDYMKDSVSVQNLEFQFVLPEFKTPEDELKVYLWNPGKGDLTYDNWEVIIYK
jgi:hypothetical protein